MKIRDEWRSVYGTKGVMIMTESDGYLLCSEPAIDHVK